MFFPREHCHEYHDLEVTLQNLGGTSPKKITVWPWDYFFQKKNDVFQFPLSYFAGTDWSPFLSHKLSWIGVYSTHFQTKPKSISKKSWFHIHTSPPILSCCHPHRISPCFVETVNPSCCRPPVRGCPFPRSRSATGRSDTWEKFGMEKRLLLRKINWSSQKKDHVWWKLLWTCLMVILDGHIHCHFHTVIFMILVNGHCYRHF